eukprot:scaffold418958_cov15-Prasinocladus_malaysianus.AAC.1
MAMTDRQSGVWETYDYTKSQKWACRSTIIFLVPHSVPIVDSKWRTMPPWRLLMVDPRDDQKVFHLPSACLYWTIHNY